MTDRLFGGPRCRQHRRLSLLSCFSLFKQSISCWYFSSCNECSTPLTAFNWPRGWQDNRIISHNIYTKHVEGRKLSLHFNGHFPGGPGLAGTRMSPFWISLELRMVATTGAIRCAKSVIISTNQHPVFYRPDVLSVTQPTVSKHWRETGHLFYQNSCRTV